MDNTVTAQELHGPRLRWALGQVEHSRSSITITRYGKPVARLVPIEDEEVVLTDVGLPATLSAPHTSSGKS